MYVTFPPPNASAALVAHGLTVLFQLSAVWPAGVYACLQLRPSLTVMMDRVLFTAGG